MKMMHHQGRNSIAENNALMK